MGSTAKIRTNDEPDEEGNRVLGVQYGVVEKSIAIAILGMLVGLIGTGVVGGIILFAKVERIDERTLHESHQRELIRLKQEEIDRKFDELRRQR